MADFLRSGHICKQVQHLGDREKSAPTPPSVVVWAFIMAMAICAWLSVLVKQGQTVVKSRTIVICCWEENFESILDKFEGLSKGTIKKIQISKDEKFIDPHIVPVDAPVSLCDQFSCANVCIFISADSAEAATSRSGPNAFDRLMASSREIVLPPVLTAPSGNDLDLRSDQRLYNDLLSMLSVSLSLSLSPPPGMQTSKCVIT